jgi:ribosome modulation factor
MVRKKRHNKSPSVTKAKDVVPYNDSFKIGVPRDTIAYKEGRVAWQNAVLADNCPYPTGNLDRVEWMTGWLDSRTAKRLGEVFERNNLTFP